MTTTKKIALAAGLAVSTLSSAQQIPQAPQPSQTQFQPAPTTSTQPCAQQAPPAPPRKPGWLEQKARALTCQKNKNLCGLPSSTGGITGQTPNPKPCPASTAPNSPATKPAIREKGTPSTPAAPTTATAGNGKPVYVCPPKSVLIPNQPYCIRADRTVIDAIAVPSELLPTLPPASSAPAPTQPAVSTKQ